MQTREQGEDTAGIRVFVYGTLKQGHGNHPALEGAEFLGRHVLEVPGLVLVDLGAYPGVVRTTTDEVRPIYGEVYLVNNDTLHVLDLIEGHPNFYERIKYDTPWKKAWVYTLPADYLEHNDVVENGCWQPVTDEEKEYFSERTGASQAV